MRDYEVITIEDIGPHTHLEIRLRPGVTTLRGRNEAGKSIALRCVSALMGGDASNLPVSDDAKRGVIEGLGTTLKIGKSTRRAGECEYEAIEDRLSLTNLVSPPIKEREAATRRRVRTLLSLTKAEISLDNFKPLLPDSLNIITDELACNDPVDTAAKVKREIEKHARQEASAAEKLERKETAIRTEWANVPTLENDSAEHLTGQYDTASTSVLELQNRRDEHERHVSQVAEAKEELAKLSFSPTQHAAAEKEAEECKQELQGCQKRVDDLERALQEAKAEAQSAELWYVQAESKRNNLSTERDIALKLNGIVAAPVPPKVSDIELQVTEQLRDQARDDIIAGDKSREAKSKIWEADEIRKKRRQHEKLAETFRDAALSVDGVLSDAIKSKVFRVVAGELECQDRHDVWRPYDQLSDGRRYTAAIEAIAENLTDPRDWRFATLDQEAWEGLDAGNRKTVVDRAKESGVVIVTAQVAECDWEVIEA